ncbi:MAG: hypothetical protein SF052_11595 [Bacteroidia bacterium]|nr:hypothetical protein [Bacteroidia bacterium]
MKNLKKFIATTFSLLVIFGISKVQAQRVSAMMNFSSFHINEVSSPNTQIDYSGSSSVSANFRYFTKNKWAYRVGAGVDHLDYTVGDGVNTNYEARRNDLKGVFGIEKHFMIGKSLDIYPGAYVPVVIVGDDILTENLDNISNGGVRSGLGVVLGANLRVLKIFRVGVEFDATYDDFSTGVRNSVNELSFVPVKGINHNTAFTVGVAF